MFFNARQDRFILIYQKMEKVEIVICSGCIANNYNSDLKELEEIMEEVETLLRQARPDKEWNLNSQSCFRFCPENRITVSVAERTTMTRVATVESIVTEVLSFFKK